MKHNRITVETHRGAPCLHVDGVPHSGLAFWHAPIESGIEEWQLFARSGVNCFQICVNSWPSAPDADPAPAWDSVLSMVLEAVPDARFCLRINTEPQQWWLDAHPEHAQIHYDQNNGDEFRWRAAYASSAWREQAAIFLKRLVEHMENRWGQQLWCYQINAGDCGEWAYSWKAVASGYAPAQIAVWREWLRGRYGDLSSLRTAWNDTKAEFTSAEPPAWSERTRKNIWPPASHLIDPSGERRLVDWLIFHGQVQAEALAFFAAAVRHELERLGRRKMITAFHGYHIWPYGSAYGACNTGFSDLDPVLNSPDIDALCTPLAYIHRNPGGVYSHHNLAATIRLHGKLFFTEDDTFTHRAKWTPWRYCCRNASETVDILQRNIAGVLAEGGTQWWMDHDSQRWYCDPVLEAGVTGMRKLADESLQHDRTSCAEVAFVTNERSFRILRQDPALIDQLWPKQQTELMRIGAPVEFIRVRDLDIARKNGDLARWKFIVVAGCLWLDPEECGLLRRTLLKDGRHILFLHGQGICDGSRLDLEFTSRLTGINLKTYPNAGPCRGESIVDGLQISWGTDKEVSPILYAEDSGAETIGWLERQYCPVLVRKKQDGWTSLWSGVPGMPWNLLGRLAENAGVHRYMEDGSQIMANAGLLSVHSAGEGTRVLRLPKPRHLIDAMDKTDYGVVSELKLDLRRGETRFFWSP